MKSELKAPLRILISVGAGNYCEVVWMF